MYLLDLFEERELDALMEDFDVGARLEPALEELIPWGRACSQEEQLSLLEQYSHLANQFDDDFIGK